MKKKPLPRPPDQPVAWCALHDILMNWRFIRRRKCVVGKQCREFYWCDPSGRPVRKLNCRRPAAWQGPEKPKEKEE